MAREVANKACYKLVTDIVTDMNYEPHIQAIITYHASINQCEGQERAGEKHDDDPGTIPFGIYTTLIIFTSSEILYAPFDHRICLVLGPVQVPPWWLANKLPYWERMVDKWCSEGWVEIHNSHREWRLQMGRASHHQATITSASTRLPGYVTSFLYSNAKFILISNHVAFFPVGCTWWPGMPSAPGICFGPQGEGVVV